MTTLLIAKKFTQLSTQMKTSSEQREQKRPNIIKRLYNWTISWADRPQGAWALGVLSFVESSFFPIPPDVLLIPLVFGKPKRWWYFALICTVASVLGGVFGWLIGNLAWSAIGDFFFNYVPGFTPENFEKVSSLYKDNAFLAIFGAAFTPIPYKIFTIAAGVCKVSIMDLVLASIVGRGGRFLLVSIIIYFVGEKARGFIEKYFNTLAMIFFVLLVAGFVCIKFFLK